MEGNCVFERVEVTVCFLNTSIYWQTWLGRVRLGLESSRSDVGLTFLEQDTESNNDEGDFRKQLTMFSQVSFTVELSLRSNQRPPF